MHPNIFATGDAVDTNESKQVVPAYAQAAVVVINVLSVLNAKEAKKAYAKSFSSIVISNGRVSHKS
jgi:NADH dehydrogenase FAD-containing subunit